MTTATLKSHDLLEYAEAIPQRIDRQAGIIFGAKLLGRMSENNREYTEEALRGALQLYEGAPVYIDHVPSVKEARRVRNQGEHWGEVRNVRLAPDGLYGDIHYLRHHPRTAEILERAERFPRFVACSHSAVGASVRRGGRDVIDEIVKVRSVDLVTQPATTKSLFETSLPLQSVSFADCRRQTREYRETQRNRMRVGEIPSDRDKRHDSKPIREDSYDEIKAELTGRASSSTTSANSDYARTKSALLEGHELPELVPAKRRQPQQQEPGISHLRHERITAGLRDLNMSYDDLKAELAGK